MFLIPCYYEQTSEGISLESLYQALDIDKIKNETTGEFIQRIKSTLQIENNDIGNHQGSETTQSRQLAQRKDRQNQSGGYSSLLIGLLVGVVIGYFVRDKNVVSSALDAINGSKEQ